MILLLFFMEFKNIIEVLILGFLKYFNYIETHELENHLDIFILTRDLLSISLFKLTISNGKRVMES